MIWKVQPCFSAKRWYIRNRSPAKMEASSPPVPPRISRIQSFESLGSLGINISFKTSCISFSAGTNSSNSAFAISRKSSSFSVAITDFASSMDCNKFWYAMYCSTIFCKSLYSLLKVLNFFKSETISGIAICCSTSMNRSRMASSCSSMSNRG